MKWEVKISYEMGGKELKVSDKEMDRTVIMQKSAKPSRHHYHAHCAEYQTG